MKHPLVRNLVVLSPLDLAIWLRLTGPQTRGRAGSVVATTPRGGFYVFWEAP